MKSIINNADPEQTDESLIRQAQRGDQESFGILYERYLGQIYRYIYYRISSAEDTEDLTESVFIKAWGAIKNYQIQTTPFLAWLYRIAHNSIIDFRRTQKYEFIDIETQYNLPDDQPSMERQLVFSGQWEIVQQALALLDPVQQEVLTLRFWAGLSHEEIAKLLGRQDGAIRVIQYRALKALRQKLDAHEK